MRGFAIKCGVIMLDNPVITRIGLKKNRIESICSTKANTVPANKINVTIPSQSIEELKHSEATFRAMFETSAVGIGPMGIDHRIIDVNPPSSRENCLR